MKKIILSIVALSYFANSNAQTPVILSGTSYTQNFDALGSGLPLGWRVDSLVNPNGDLGDDAIFRFSSAIAPWSNTTRGFKNVASADGLTATTASGDQSSSTDRALGIRQVSAAGWDDKDSLVSANLYIANTVGLANFNLEFKIQSLHTAAKRYNNWIVQFGLGSNPTSFINAVTVPSTLTIDSNFSNTTVNVNFGTSLDNQTQPVWIRFLPADTTMGSGSRPMVGLDDVTLTWSGVAVNNTPQATSFTPADNSTNVPISTSSLSIMFDKNITLGTGNVTVYNLTDATNQVIAASACTVAGMNVTIPGVNLLNSKDYAVQYDSTCFKYTTFNGLGIYNNTSWNFSTIGTVNPPVTSLNEVFTGCLAPNLGSFTEFSAVGSQNWRCTTFGHNDANAVYMNGFASSMSNDNEDYLISPALNMSAMTNPMLHFWSKRRFSGTTTKEVFVSNNYTGDATTATWTALPANLTALDTVWTAFNNSSLNAYKSSTMHIAFKYVSAASGSSDEWTVDDVTITDGPLSVRNAQFENMQIAVIGNASEGVLNLVIDSKLSANYSIKIVDILGNTVHQSAATFYASKNKHSIQLPTLSNGVYVMTVANGNSIGTVKFTK